MRIEELLSFLAEHDVREYVFWTSDLEFYVDCSDVFFWGAGDAEQITAENFEEFKSAVVEAGADGPALFCARMRKERPQGAVYEHLDEENWALFDACGPRREVGFGNPRPHPVDGPF
jgi:hypothetical protein